MTRLKKHILHILTCHFSGDRILNEDGREFQASDRETWIGGTCSKYYQQLMIQTYSSVEYEQRVFSFTSKFCKIFNVIC